MDPSAFDAEAQYLHRALFKSGAPAHVADRYSAYLARAGVSGTPVWLDKMMRAGADAEAAEFALRTCSSHHPLRQRLHVLCLITEANPEYWDFFYNRHSHAIRAWFSLSWSTMRSIWLWLKGRWLIRKYGLL